MPRRTDALPEADERPMRRQLCRSGGYCVQANGLPRSSTMAAVNAVRGMIHGGKRRCVCHGSTIAVRTDYYERRGSSAGAAAKEAGQARRFLAIAAVRQRASAGWTVRPLRDRPAPDSGETGREHKAQDGATDRDLGKLQKIVKIDFHHHNQLAPVRLYGLRFNIPARRAKKI
jgi:hypothetical protein